MRASKRERERAQARPMRHTFHEVLPRLRACAPFPRGRGSLSAACPVRSSLTRFPRRNTIAAKCIGREKPWPRPRQSRARSQKVQADQAGETGEEGKAGSQRLVRGPETQRGEFRTADADLVSAAHRRDPSRARRGRPRRTAPQLRELLRAGDSGLPRRWRGAACGRARRSRPCCRTCRRCWRRISACRCAARCSTPSTRGSTPATIAYILEHGEAKVLITDREYAAQVGPALARLKKPPLVIDVDDPLYTGPGERLGKIEYEAFHRERRSGLRVAARPPTRASAIALNYTSGTTGNPKGVVYHHRGTFLEVGRQHHGVAAAAEAGVPVDAADVPLQRLVLPVVGHRDGRHACLPAPGRSGADLPDDRRAWRDAHVRRADRAQHAGQRAGRAAPHASTTSSTSRPAARRRPPR